MQQPFGFPSTIRALALVLLAFFAGRPALGQTEKVLYSFKGGADGATPDSSLILDSAGNLYGVTFGKPNASWGSVYRLHRRSDGTWVKAELYRFSGRADGSEPYSRLLLDKAGNLYGTTYAGGIGGGTVFELSPPAGGNGSWTETVLYAFRGGDDGAGPNCGVISDAQGNLYGTTTLGGGSDNGGTIFELAPDGSGGWSESVLFSFAESGGGPYGSLVLDKDGHLFGTTFRGGDNNGGAAFELSPLAGGVWQEKTIHSFGDLFGFGDGSEPIASLTIGPNGHLFGTTLVGGGACFNYPFGCGTVFELALEPGGNWAERVLYAFHGSDGFIPYGEVVFDKAGNLYGTTVYGGNAGGCFYDSTLVNCGTAFKLSPAAGGAWAERVLVNFAGGALGGESDTGLVLDALGNLYGSSEFDGQYNAGMIFEITQR